MRNTIQYLLLLIFSGFVANNLQVPLYVKILVFFLVYYTIFIVFEILDIFAGLRIWDQTERTSNCYDWLVHYLKNNYGIVDGEKVFDYTENIYFDDFNASNKQSNYNKYILQYTRFWDIR